MFEYCTKEYSYKDICETLNWKITTGEAKQRQIKCIEDSYEFYHPINPKSKKEKKSYVFTKMKHEPILYDGRKNNGGARANAGNKKLLSDEAFNYIWMCFVIDGYKKNKYYEREWLNEIFFTNALLFKEFGFDYYRHINYGIRYSETDTLAKKVFEAIVYDCIKSQTIARLCKRYGYKKNSLPKGILRSRSKVNIKQIISDNELLPKYEEYLAEELEKREFKNIKEAIDAEKYLEIIEEVQSKFEIVDKKYNVQRLNCIKVTDMNVKELGNNAHHIDSKKLAAYTNEFKQVILESVERSINRRIENSADYSVKLNKNQRMLLKYYFYQLINGKDEINSAPIPLSVFNDEPVWLINLS